MTKKKQQRKNNDYLDSSAAARYVLEQVKKTGEAVIVARNQNEFELLDILDGNKVEAAQILGVARATLYRFLDAEKINKKAPE